MPLWLRKFTFHEINNFYKKESDDIKKAQDKSSGKQTVIDSSGKVSPPQFKKPTKNTWR